MRRGAPLRRRTAFRSTAPTTQTRKRAARDTGPNRALRDAVLARDQWTCQRCGKYLPGQPYSLQHRLPRGRGGGNSLANLVLLCGSATTPDSCHEHVESYRERANREGWLVPTGTRPEDWPVHRLGHGWWMPGEGWREVEPAPGQRTGAA